MRARIDEVFEKAVSSANSLSDLREAAERVHGLKEALADSVEPVKTLIHSLFSRFTQR